MVDKTCFQHERLTKSEHQALLAMRRGNATEWQQQLALHVILQKLCRPHDFTYIPDSFDQSAFLAGRAFVGARILRILDIPIGSPKITYLPEDQKNVL